MADKKISQLNDVTLPLDGTEEIAIVQGGETKKVSKDNYDSNIQLKAISVATSRDFTNADKNKVLIVQNSGIVLTMPTIGIDSDFNCTVKPLTGFDATLAGAVTYDAPNGLTIAENKMISIVKLGLIYIVSP